MATELGVVTRRDIVINKGSKFELTVAVPDWIDPTGWTAKMQVRPEKESATLIDEYSSTGAGAELSIVVGAKQVLVDVHGSATATYTFTNAAYDLFLYEPVTNEPHKILEGTVRLNKSVTV
jgi:hypothetical protein